MSSLTTLLRKKVSMAVPKFTATVKKNTGAGNKNLRTIIGIALTSADAEKEANAYSKITTGTITRSYKQADFGTAPTTAAGTSDANATFHFIDTVGADFYKPVKGVSTAYLVVGSDNRIDITQADIAALPANTFFDTAVGALTLVDARFTSA
jgi:hypothetical protein